MPVNINARNCLPILVCNEQDVTYDGQTNWHDMKHCAVLPFVQTCEVMSDGDVWGQYG